MTERKPSETNSGLTRRNFLKLSAAGAGALALINPLGHFAGAQGNGASKRPNIVFFITDDESWLERSIYGWSKLPTPAFDRVAKQGVLFNYGYTSAPSCAPSRGSFLTGRNFWELEQGAMIQGFVPNKFPLLTDLLAEAGYQVARVGKGMGPYVPIPGIGHGDDAAGPHVNAVLVEEPQEKISSIDYAASFAKFLDEREAEKPFFFWVGVTEPHLPWAKDNYKKLEERYGMTLDDIDVPGFIPDTLGVRKERGNFLYEICYADEHLGRILDALEKKGELDNTIVIMVGDNGDAPPRSKASPYDWGTHEPMAIMWPSRVKSGRVVEDFVNFPDLTPTLLEAAGAEVPKSMTGRSILNDILLSDKQGLVNPTRDFIVTGLEWHGEFAPENRAGRMIRDHRYEYVVHYGGGIPIGLRPQLELPDSEFEKTAETAGLAELLSRHPNHPKVKPFVKLLTGRPAPEEFYDLEKDPWHLNNVIDDPAYAEIKERLKARMKAYQLETGDPRATGDMAIFEKTREFVQKRKKEGYPRAWDEFSPELKELVKNM
ncbi:sulfatase [bacterium]|nr:sulfatase [bacterium]